MELIFILGFILNTEGQVVEYQAQPMNSIQECHEFRDYALKSVEDNLPPGFELRIACYDMYDMEHEMSPRVTA